MSRCRASARCSAVDMATQMTNIAPMRNTGVVMVSSPSASYTRKSTIAVMDFRFPVRLAAPQSRHRPHQTARKFRSHGNIRRGREAASGNFAVDLTPAEAGSLNDPLHSPQFDLSAHSVSFPFRVGARHTRKRPPASGRPKGSNAGGSQRNQRHGCKRMNQSTNAG